MRGNTIHSLRSALLFGLAAVLGLFALGALLASGRDPATLITIFSTRFLGILIEALPFLLLGAIPRLRRYARSLVFDTSAADDIVQTALERALGHWRQFDPRRDMVLWLLAIAHNAWLDALRRDRHLDVIAPERVTEAMDRQRSHEPDVGLQIDLVAALTRLSPDQRSAMLLVAVEQLSYAEAAERIEAAVKKVLAKGLRTPDIHSTGTTKVGTREMGEAVLRAL